MSENGKHYDAVIIGAGPGWLSAHINLKRIMTSESRERRGTLPGKIRDRLL